MKVELDFVPVKPTRAARVSAATYASGRVPRARQGAGGAGAGTGGTGAVRRDSTCRDREDLDHSPVVRGRAPELHPRMVRRRRAKLRTVHVFGSKGPTSPLNTKLSQADQSVRSI